MQVARDTTQAVHRCALAVREEQADRAQGAVEEVREARPQVIEPLPRRRRDVRGVRVERLQAGALARVGDRVDLVEDDDPRGARTDHVEHLGDGLVSRRSLRRLEARVGDDQDEVRQRRLFERRSEGVDELVGQLADETDRVGDYVVTIAVAKGAARRVEGLEEAISDGHVRAGQSVQERRLAGVGIAGERDERHRAAQAPRPLRAARARHALDTRLQDLDAAAHDPAVDLELRLSGTAHVDAGPESREHEALAAHPRELVLELCQVYLQGPLQRVRVL